GFFVPVKKEAPRRARALDEVGWPCMGPERAGIASIPKLSTGSIRNLCASTPPAALQRKPRRHGCGRGGVTFGCHPDAHGPPHRDASISRVRYRTTSARAVRSCTESEDLIPGCRGRE